MRHSEDRTMTVRRYHSVLVVLHWLVAILISLQLAGGYFNLAKMANSDPAKLSTLKIHMLGGMLILVLMAIRFIVRLRTSHPEPTTSQRTGIGRLRTPLHLGFYALVLAVVSAGWYTGYLISGAYATPGATLPADLAQFPSRIIHAWLALALFLLIVLHILAAIKEMMTGDVYILGRVGFGKRK
jgi:cytochrome b561